MTQLSPTDRHLIHAYLDNQLDEEAAAAFEQRVAAEPALAAALTAERTVRQTLRQRLHQTQAPASLRTAVQAHLAPSSPAPGRQRVRAWLTTPRPIRPAVAAVYTLLLVLITAGLFFWLSPSAGSIEEHTIFRQFGGKHAVYLDQTGLLDVQGEPAEIEQWFQGRAPFTVTVPLLAGWWLEGGRLGEFHHQGAAHLVYGRAGQDISLTTFAAQDSDFPAQARRRVGRADFFVGDDGQHLVILWRSGEVGYALVGSLDVGIEALLAIATELRGQLN